MRTLLASHEPGALEDAVHRQAVALQQRGACGQPLHRTHQVQQHSLQGYQDVAPLEGPLAEVCMLSDVSSILGMSAGLSRWLKVMHNIL